MVFFSTSHMSLVRYAAITIKSLRRIKMGLHREKEKKRERGIGRERERERESGAPKLARAHYMSPHKVEKSRTLNSATAPTSKLPSKPCCVFAMMTCGVCVDGKGLWLNLQSQLHVNDSLQQELDLLKVIYNKIAGCQRAMLNDSSIRMSLYTHRGKTDRKADRQIRTCTDNLQE